MITFDAKFKMLVDEVRAHRAKMLICPSAKKGVNVPAIIQEFCENGFYKSDYQAITSYFANDMVIYEEAVRVILQLVETHLFEENI